jgi:hypothetical protein
MKRRRTHSPAAIDSTPPGKDADPDTREPTTTLLQRMTRPHKALPPPVRVPDRDAAYSRRHVSSITHARVMTVTNGQFSDIPFHSLLRHDLEAPTIETVASKVEIPRDTFEATLATMLDAVPLEDIAILALRAFEQTDDRVSRARGALLLKAITRTTAPLAVPFVQELVRTTMLFSRRIDEFVYHVAAIMAILRHEVAARVYVDINRIRILAAKCINSTTPTTVEVGLVALAYGNGPDKAIQGAEPALASALSVCPTMVAMTLVNMATGQTKVFELSRRILTAISTSGASHEAKLRLALSAMINYPDSWSWKKSPIHECGVIQLALNAIVAINDSPKPMSLATSVTIVNMVVVMNSALDSTRTGNDIVDAVKMLLRVASGCLCRAIVTVLEASYAEMATISDWYSEVKCSAIEAMLVLQEFREWGWLSLPVDVYDDMVNAAIRNIDSVEKHREPTLPPSIPTPDVIHAVYHGQYFCAALATLVSKGFGRNHATVHLLAVAPWIFTDAGIAVLNETPGFRGSISAPLLHARLPDEHKPVPAKAICAAMSRLATFPGPPAEAPACVICMTSSSDPWALVSCGHTYHLDCLTQWCAASPRCPLCRADMVKEAVSQSTQFADTLLKKLSETKARS